MGDPQGDAGGPVAAAPGASALAAAAAAAAEATAQYRRVGVCPNPACGAQVERTAGCNDMRCRCTARFTYAPLRTAQEVAASWTAAWRVAAMVPPPRRTLLGEYYREGPHALAERAERSALRRVARVHQALAF